MNESEANAKANLFRLDIQGIRGIGLIFMVLFHIGIVVPGGFTAIDLFYVISGYVITQLLLREHSRNGKIALGDFYIKRIKRILPSVLIMLSVTAIPAVFLTPPSYFETSAKTGIAAAGMFSNIFLAQSGSASYFDVDSGSNPYLHTWSLGAEWQLYLILPLFLLLAISLAKHTRLQLRTTILLVFGLTTLASFIATVLISLRDPHSMWSYYGVHTRYWEFGPGIMLAAIPAIKNQKIRQILSYLGIATWIATMVLLDHFMRWPSEGTLLPVLVVSLLILGGTSGAKMPLPNRILSFKPLAALGDRSYSVYIWHWPLISFAHGLYPGNKLAASIAALISLPIAFASFKYVEDPIRRTKIRSHAKVYLISTAAVCATALLMIPLLQGSKIIQKDQTVKTKLSMLGQHIDLTAGCDASQRNYKVNGWKTDGECRFPPKGTSKGDAWIVGDSQAGHLSEAFIRAANKLGLTAVIASKSTCPFADGVVSFEGKPNLSCREQYDTSLSRIIEAKPKLVFISNGNFVWTKINLGREKRFFSFTPGNRTDSGFVGSNRFQADRSVDAFGQATRRAVTTLRRHGIAVTVAQSPPYFEDWQPRRLSAAGMHLHNDANIPGHPTEQALLELGQSRKILSGAVEGFKHVSIFDPLPVLCRDETCTLQLEGKSLYRDSKHLSVWGSVVLSHQLKTSFKTAFTK